VQFLGCRLHYLTVEMNKISSIGRQTFAGLRYLKSLNLRGNKLRLIETGTFKALGNLTTLSLSDNPLEVIEVTQHCIIQSQYPLSLTTLWRLLR
jgi:Leucine-rich repeat (LRR) protein